MAVSFARRPVIVARKGGVPVRLRCAGTTANRCVGTLVLRSRGTVAKKVYSIRRGGKAVVRVGLGRKLLRALRVARRHGGALQARVFARTAQTSGSPTISSRLIRLK